MLELLGLLFSAEFFITKVLYISLNTKRTPYLQSTAGNWRTILGLVFEMRNILISCANLEEKRIKVAMKVRLKDRIL
jgi:hypothetical protein